jgi:hypothetical protein
MAENGILDYQGMNQAIYRGATSNIVVDTQSMSIEIGAGNTSHTSNLHFECNHDANVASIKLHSNVTTEFSRSKKLIKYPRVALTGSTSGGYTAQTSSINVSTQDAWYAFDNSEPDDNTSRWRTASSRYTNSGATPPSEYLFTGSEAGDWISIQLPEKMKLVYYTMTGIHTHTPQEGVIYGYDSDTSTWHKVSTFYFNTEGTSGNTPLFSPEFHTEEGVGLYSKYAMIVTKINGNDAASLYEWKLYGVPEYDPDAAGLDVKVTSYPNVPNTDWLEVYYDAKGLTPGAVGSSISGLGGTTISATKLGDPQVSNDAFVFDGSGDAIVSGATSLSGNPPLSYSVWFKTNSISSGSGSNSIVQIGHAGTAKSLGFRIKGTGDTNPGNYRFYVYGGATNESVETNIKAEIGTWTHATVVYDGLNSKLYMDGKFAVGNTNTATNLALDSGAKVALGNYIDSNGALYSGGTVRDYDGSIANFRLFNRVLTSDEVWQLYSYQKEYFGHGDLSMTLKAGRLGIGTSEPRAALDVRGTLKVDGPATFTGRSNFTESLFFYTGNTPTHYYISTYKNLHGYYLNTLIPPDSHIGSYGTGGDNQVFTEASYGGGNELCGSHFDCMVYWLKYAPVGHVHRLNWCSKNGSGGSQTYGQKTSDTQIRLWGYWFSTGTYDRDWTSGVYFSISTSTISVSYQGAAFQ